MRVGRHLLGPLPGGEAFWQSVGNAMAADGKIILLGCSIGVGRLREARRRGVGQAVLCLGEPGRRRQCRHGDQVHTCDYIGTSCEAPSLALRRRLS